jgi:hypothetical protein
LLSNHRPETVKRCVSGICQHTCPSNTIEKCKHALTLRYWVNDRSTCADADGRDRSPDLAQ